MRVLTAIAMGIAFLCTAAWAWNQLEVVNLPKSGWSFALSGISGSGTAGETVDLLALDPNQRSDKPALIVIGTGRVDSYTAEGAGAKLVARDVVITIPKRTESEVKAVRAPATTAQAFNATVSSVFGIDTFDKSYLQGGVAGLIALIGAIMIYWYVGANAKSAEFLIATDGEMKKVNWSTKKIIKDSTMVVIGATFLIAALIFVFDYGLQVLMRAIKVLPS